MENSNMFFIIFSMLAGLVSTLITILIGVLLTKAEDLLHLFNLQEEGKPLSPRKQKTIKLIKLIGTLMIVCATLKGLDKLLDLFRYLVNVLSYIF